ncbi:MAG TPA: glucokinase [Candidatus Babeliales bacterium]|nr:glucokinase [Candidatus Babeliales bacterium]
MLTQREVHYVDIIPRDLECVMVADIGGTNSNFGFFSIKPYTHGFESTILTSIHIKSQQITDFPTAVEDILNYVKKTYGMTIKRSCFAAAGVVSENHDYCKPTNLNFIIDSKQIMAKTGLTCAVIVNDFEVIGHGLHKLPSKSLIQVHHGTQRPRANRAIIGAGTGLGKCMLMWDNELSRYLPHASEGGHADFPAQNQLELDLINFIKTINKNQCNVSWEDMLSGNGIEHMYLFFKQRNSHVAASPQLKNGLPPDEVFRSRNLDEHSKNSFQLYAQIYARCAKDFALDALALGGIYIAGGIASKNLPLFEQSSFLNEFESCGKQQALLKQVPIFVITDYDVSLYGAVEYMILEGLCG